MLSTGWCGAVIFRSSWSCVSRKDTSKRARRNFKMANRLMISLIAGIGVFAFTTPVFAQTLIRDGATVALPADIDVPRNQDNKPSVLARNPAPRTRDGKIDFTGVWTTPSNPGEARILTERFGPNPTTQRELTPWAAER